MRRGLIVFVVLLVAGSAAAAVFFKPARIFFPERFGLVCVSDTLCLEELARQAEAEALVGEATGFVSDRLGPLESTPEVLMCSSRACFSRFGNEDVAALYFWGAGIIVINEIGWEKHILRHEIIHHWQGEHFGAAKALRGLPRWYIEGMAYVLSEDPRAEIPHPVPEAQRQQFRDWIEAGNDWRVPPGRDE